MARRRKKQVKDPMPDAGPADETVGPTPERLAQYGEAPDRFRADGGREVVRISVVDWLFSHERITGESYSAAYRLLADWHRGGQSQSVTAGLRDVVDNGGQADAFSVARMTAQRHYALAIGFLGPVHSHPIHEMVEGDTSPVRYGQKFLHWKDRAEASAAAKQRLIDALERLALFYSPPPLAARPKRAHSYIRPGGKPVIA